jgi:acyl carrier protein
MTRQELNLRLTKLLENVLGKTLSNELRQEVPLDSIQGVDSMALVNLIIEIENEFHVSFDEEIADDKFRFSVENILQKLSKDSRCH